MTGYILVRRDFHFRDVGVFTGHMVLVESAYELWAGQPVVKGEPEISPHIEHAFVFPGSWQAWHWADRLMPDPSYPIKRIEFMSWDVREHGDLHVGEVRPWRTIARHDARAAHQAILETAA